MRVYVYGHWVHSVLYVLYMYIYTAHHRYPSDVIFCIFMIIPVSSQFMLSNYVIVCLCTICTNNFLKAFTESFEEMKISP